MKDTGCVLICAGGTGGHVIPGLTLAESLQAKNINVQWMGSRAGIESKLVPNTNIEIHYIEVSALRGRSKLSQLFAPFKILKAIWQARKIIKKVKPKLVVAMGGYASGPGGIAAKLSGIPLLIHEQNSVPGFTNKILSFISNKTLAAFPNTFSKNNVFIVGNPVRKAFSQCLEPTLIAEDHPVNILVVGGSKGAKVFNDIAPSVLSNISGANVWHQTGELACQQVCDHYRNAKSSAKVEAFIDDMVAAYQWANIVICRAGAMTVFEIMAAGRAAIFVPYPYAVDDHQTMNANYLVKKSAGVLLPQTEFNENTLRAEVESLIKDKNKCYFLAKNAFALKNDHALMQMTQHCLEIMND